MPPSSNNVLDSLTFLSDSILASHQQKLLDLIDRGWEAFWREIFGDEFVDGFDAYETGDVYHATAIEWHWNARIALLKNERPPDDYFVYFPTWPRGFGKTSILRRMLLVDAMLTYAYGQRGYALIPGGTKAKIRGSAMSLEKMLHEPKIAEYCPELSHVETNVYGRSRGWTADFISTKAGYVFHFIGLDEGVAGANVDNVRPTFIAPDDIDSREDSPVIAETRFRVLTSEILPARQANTLIFWAQNLISRYSVRYRVESQQERILTNRKPAVRIPAIRDEAYEQRTVNGIVKDIVIKGKVTWRKWNLQRIQDEIDTYGLPAFKREMQHEVEDSNEGLIFYNYDDDVHVISESEFSAVYGSTDVWLSWRKKWANDWARTKTDKHANVAFWQTTSDSSTDVPNISFLMHPMSFPANSAPEDVAERVLSCLSPYAYKDVTWATLRKDVLKRINADVHTGTIAEKIAYEHGELSKIIPQYTTPLLQRCNVQAGEMSHEQDTVRKIYSSIYHLGMKPTNPKKHGGIETINREMMVDYDEPHPFRDGHNGYSQWFMVVPDDKEREYTQKNGLPVYMPKKYPLAIQTKDLWDDDLCRFQISNWRFREPVLTASGEVVDDPLKLYDDFCFVEGTQVSTKRGDIPVERVTDKDEVLTRQGWQSVAMACPTGRHPVHKMELSDGTVLKGTGNHPIWTESRGWVELSKLSIGNVVQMNYNNPLWQTTPLNPNPNVSSSKGLLSIGIQTPSNVPTESISHPTLQINERATIIYISKFGRMLTAKCPKAITFITKTRTLLITTFQTLNAFPHKNTYLGTLKNAPTPQRGTHFWWGGERRTWQVENYINGINPTKEGSFCETRHFAKDSTKHLSNWFVSIANNLISQLTLNLDFAVNNVRGVIGTASLWSSPLFRVPNVANRSNKGFAPRNDVHSVSSVPDHKYNKNPKSAENVELNLRPSILGNISVQPYVVSITLEKDARQVFNLQVKNVPEFYANGVLVHNCNAMQMAAVGAPLRGTSLTIEQKLKLVIPQSVQQEVATAKTGTERWLASLNMDFEREIAMEKLAPVDDEDYDLE